MHRDKPSFSVLIPSREQVGPIEHSTGSVLMRDYPDFEIVISDHASSTACASVVVKLDVNVLSNGSPSARQTIELLSNVLIRRWCAAVRQIRRWPTANDTRKLIFPGFAAYKVLSWQPKRFKTKPCRLTSSGKSSRRLAEPRRGQPVMLIDCYAHCAGHLGLSSGSLPGPYVKCCTFTARRGWSSKISDNTRRPLRMSSNGLHAEIILQRKSRMPIHLLHRMKL